MKEKESADFYWKPKDKTPVDEDAYWYTLQACGRNFLGSVVKSVCEQAGIHRKTNHSLRATGATRLFAANVPEKLIYQKERDIAVLKHYVCTSVLQLISNN